MVCAQKSAKKAPQLLESPQKHCKRVLSPIKSLKVIEKLKETGKETHLKAMNMKKCYAGHVKHGCEWLAEFFQDETSSDSKKLPWLPSEHIVGMDDPFTNPAFAHAFDRVPNEFSNQVLSLFLTYKGFHQNLQRMTVEGKIY